MKNFIKKQLANLKEWFISSNRWVHLMSGWAIYLGMVFVYGIWFAHPPLGPTVVGAYVATLIAMCAVEWKDKAWGGKWDWKDINAGMFLGNCMLLAYIIVSIVRACNY